ncbi:MAG: exbD [Phycisphaerales bacterium]|nr:exbD [Phycisphaerales bacterium]
MPVKLGSKLPTESAEARIEIIPLIDIMFFLLASFMLVSLSMVTLKTIKVNLPASTSAPAASDSRKDVVDLSIDKSGALFIDRQRTGDNDVVAKLAAMRGQNPSLRVVISGDRYALHGDIVHALDLVRSAGIEKVAFEIRQKPVKATSP